VRNPLGDTDKKGTMVTAGDLQVALHDVILLPKNIRLIKESKEDQQET